MSSCVNLCQMMSQLTLMLISMKSGRRVQEREKPLGSVWAS